MIDILIPTLHRADKLEALLDNIHETTRVSHQVYLIAEASDVKTYKALVKLRDPRVYAVIDDYGSCAKAMNAGYRASRGPYVFTGNDDLRFHVGWDVAALWVRKPIVGTNDGHGRMTCFALCQRDYIQRHSGVYDKPNTLFHEYESQYVDTELAEYAKARGAWGQAHMAVTEHLHWEHGKADRNHPNYLKAQATCGADHAIYQRRKRAWEESLSQARRDSSALT